MLESIRRHMWEEEQECEMPEPMTENVYENARRITIQETMPMLAGFQIDTDEKKGHLDLFKNGWIGRKAGDRIRFEAEAACIAVQYRKSVAGPALRAMVTLDGDTFRTWILDGKFEEDWGDCAQIAVILHHGEKKKHHIEIEVLDDQLQGAVPFYLMSLILA